ncbi:LysM peptidoglycan-binding domain-containing protein [Alkalicoccobacillus plakortidis]|uniref:LysM peptidoglycan-binding domain-containing protein n=1 Tax=Alkalicoccobacillus plakortidis TaxID=444060 RepID=A0ABT0XFU5_9BACI|nr:LysM peptidoglycan-binding domain-containing protein [Alkalicoccobacillus plakortidis]MCM2674099.1 LysM peptidoglycan-binding domain-containing protein [Alkalicoccobacillus plakortidis]
MPKSVYEIWLSQGKDKLRLPVLPETIDFASNVQNESVKVSRFGELTFIDDPGAREISFASYFPKRHTSQCEYSNFPSPENCIDKIEKWLKNKEPVRLIVTGTKINILCSIEDFPYGEGEMDIGDRTYSVRLKEYKVATPRKIKQARPVQKKRPSPVKTAKVTMYTVKKGDTLWAIAGRKYGNNLQWRKIWNENKAQIIKRDARNNRQQGHWIHIGFKLRIPPK